MVESKRGYTIFSGRIKIVIVGMIVIFMLLVARLFYLQILCEEELSAAARAQRNMAIEGLDTRGTIYDRNMNPLVGGESGYYYFIPASHEDNISLQLLEAIDAVNVTGSESSTFYNVYRSGIFNSLVNRRLKDEYGAYVLKMNKRYDDQQSACHLIGYVNKDDGKGVSGLELAYDAMLYSEEDEYYVTVDGAGTILRGLAPVKSEDGIFNTAGSSTLITTIDERVQNICETILGERGEGAVMVSHAENGEVLAWASNPTFNPNNLEEYIQSDEDCLVDKCIQGLYPPGSVFKVVVAAAALESEKINPLETFECTGTVEVEGIEMSCSMGPEGGHGEVDMYEAMSLSCNCYFTQLGEKTGIEAIIDMAEKMGFGNTVFEEFTYESSGNLPEKTALGVWDVSNLSIGQGYLLATPAQIHRMMSIVASGGVLRDFTVVKSEKVMAEKRVISETTARCLEQMLEKTMEEGTGAPAESGNNTDFNLDGIELYGKTGTAEATDNGEAVKQCWFSGYFRKDGETFLVTVLIENGISGSTTALPVFREIASAIISIY